METCGGTNYVGIFKQIESVKMKFVGFFLEKSIGHLHLRKYKIRTLGATLPRGGFKSVLACYDSILWTSIN